MYLLSLVLLLNSSYFTFSKTTPKVHTIEIREMKFHPAELRVQKGDTVVWINKDLVAHDVTEETRKAWTSSVIPSGKSWRMVVAESVEYFCSIHQVMKGKIVVQTANG